MPVTVPLKLASFREVWVVDTEYISRPGQRPIPVCLVASELHSGSKHCLWQTHLVQSATPPYQVGDDCLFVAFSASGDLQVHHALGWPLPVNVLDLHVEYLNWTNGRRTQGQSGLLAALMSFGIPGMSGIAKTNTRDLILGGGPWSAEQQCEILHYCGLDVAATTALLAAMVDKIDLPQSMLRGSYVRAVAQMEWNGVPFDGTTFDRIMGQRDAIREGLIDTVDAEFGFYQNGAFKSDRFADYVLRNGLAWPRTETGLMKLDQDTFREQSDIYPQIKPVSDLRRTLSGLKSNKLAVGDDGRARTYLAPFMSITGRNQPSTSSSIFGFPAWWRSLIRPEPGYGIAYLDWDQQEFGIAAALSGDDAMMEAYRSGDPYMAFAIQVGAAPVGATKNSHAEIRNLYKQCVLAVQYGMGPESLARRLGIHRFEAEHLLARHQRTYHRFWAWSDATYETALARGWIETLFGWRLHLRGDVNERSVRNFPMQANGAEMMRIACILAVEDDIELCMPVHDALLMTAPIEQMDDHGERLHAAMEEASRIVLNGFVLTSGEERFVYPDRFVDKRGVPMWAMVTRMLQA